MFNLSPKWDKWFAALWSAAISGFATPITAMAASGVANSMGASIEPIHWKQALDIGVCGAVVGVLNYLKQSPLPPSNGDTQFIQKPPTPPK